MCSSGQRRQDTDQYAFMWRIWMKCVNNTRNNHTWYWYASIILMNFFCISSSWSKQIKQQRNVFVFLLTVPTKTHGLKLPKFIFSIKLYNSLVFAREALAKTTNKKNQAILWPRIQLGQRMPWVDRAGR